MSEGDNFPRQRRTGGTTTAKAESLGTDALHRAEDLAHAASLKAHDLTSQLRHYPRLMLGLIVLSAFCLGIGLTALSARMGYLPGTAQWKYRHEPASLEAHQALDTLMGHMYNIRDGVKDKSHMAAAAADEAKAKILKSMASAGAEGAAKLYSAKESVKDGYESTKDSANSLGEKISEKFGDLKDSLMGKVHETVHPKETGLKGAIHNAENKIKDMLHL